MSRCRVERPREYCNTSHTRVIIIIIIIVSSSSSKVKVVKQASNFCPQASTGTLWEKPQ